MRGGSKPDASIGGVENRVKPFKEYVAQGEVKAFTTARTKIVHDKVDSASGTTDLGIEKTRPDLSVGGELVADLEESYV